MNLRKSILLLASGICITANAFIINVSNLPEQLLGRPLFIKTVSDKVMLDSITINDSCAVLSGTLPTTELCYLNYSFPVTGGIRTNFYPIFVHNDTISITFNDYENGKLNVSGGKLNNEYSAVLQYSNRLVPLDSLNKEKLRNYGEEKIKENSSNPLGAYLLNYFRSIFSPTEWLGLYNNLSPEMAQLDLVKKKAVTIANKISTGEGKMYAEIQGISPDGSKVNLSDYINKGKYILLDFWASWCGPCRKEAKETLIPLYEKYGDNENFMILGVMTSDQTENHLKGLENTKYPWPQLINCDNKASQEYGFEFIPQIMLLSPEGKILRRDLRGEKIWQTVEQVLNSK